MTTSKIDDSVCFVGDLTGWPLVRIFTKIFATDHNAMEQFMTLYREESLENRYAHIRTLDQILRTHIRAEAYHFMDKCRVRVYGEDAIKFKLVYGEHFK